MNVLCPTSLVHCWTINTILSLDYDEPAPVRRRHAGNMNGLYHAFIKTTLELHHLSFLCNLRVSKYGWQVSAISGLNRSGGNMFLPYFYIINILSAANI